MVGRNTMAENDIYNNKLRFEKFVDNLEKITRVPENGIDKYYCKNPENLKYFRKLFNHFEMKDLSYIRRLRICQVLKMVTFLMEKNLVDCEREDINVIVAFAHKRNKTIASKRDVIKDIKCMWRVLFPAKDNEGRIDETITPYVIRHLSRKIDKSKEKLRNDRITVEEFRRILDYFTHDTRMQAFLMLSVESLGRPQEILYTKIRDYEFYDNYAKIWISEHGKEGTGFLQCIDSYPYVLEWFNKHPCKSNKEAFFFINLRNKTDAKFEQLTNHNINQQLKIACSNLGIDRTITCYSLKRNGVTFRRQRGDSDLEIQHAARWTSTKQLQIYDMSNQNDALRMELEKRGLTNKNAMETSSAKMCLFCNHRNGFTSEMCSNCKRPLDRNKIEEMTKTAERIQNNEIIQRFGRMEELFEKMIDSKRAEKPFSY